MGRLRRQRLGRCRRGFSATGARARRAVARQRANELAIGRLAGGRDFTLVVSHDVNLHHEVFNFTSPGGGDVIFLHMDHLLEQRFLC